MQPQDPAQQETARSLNVGDTQKRLRRFWRSIPSPPRCKLCHRPFGAPGGPVMRLMGLGPWHGNPKYCSGCFKALYRHRDGADIECSLIFADVRGSTGMAETMRPSDYRRLMDRFYESAFDAFVSHDAFVDKFVGDEVIGIFVPALTESLHARQAILSGIDLLQATGHGAAAPWIPVGIGVNTGVAYVGAVGTADHIEFTALGDTVNITARLSSNAGPGELLVTEAAARAAQLTDLTTMERRHLELKGRSETVDVVVLSAETRLDPLPPGP